MARILVSTPLTNGFIRAETDIALRRLEDCGCEVIPHYVNNYSVDRARNTMVRKAVELGCSHLFMVDSDTAPPPHALIRLLSRNLDVCMGWYVRGTSDDGRTNAIKMGTANFEDSYYAHELNALATDGIELVEVKGNGMGCALVRTSVFERVKHPWFKFTDYPNGSGLGEDYWFCQQARNAGCRLYVDTTVGCAHVHDRVLRPE